MKKVIITISYYSYINLRQIIQGIEKICEKRDYVFISKNHIPPELILVPMLKNRNLFLYDAQKTFDGYPAIKDFKFEYYQIAALYHCLNDIADLPDNVKLIRMTCKEIIEDNTKVIIKSDFQK